MTARLVIERPGLFSTLQDFGRFGYQAFGISASGAMDSASLQIANALVGNRPDMAAIEMTATGLAARVEGGSVRIALAGAEMALSVNGQPVSSRRGHALADGDLIEIGPARTGLRAYLAVGGGFAVAPTLGSLSTHSRSALGGVEGRALRQGDRLDLADAATAPLMELPAGWRPDWSRRVRVVLGPQEDFFTPEAIATFLSAEYRVSPRADRMGAELEGPVLAHARGFNIVSDGIVNGSIQVPGHGRPVVLLADRQTTGGYPKIATVIGPDLPVIGQTVPGEAIRFARVGARQAAEAARAEAEALDALRAALRPPGRGQADAESEGALAGRLLAENLVGGVCSAFETAPEGETP